MTNNDNKMLNDDQMGQLLETFYRTEMPKELDHLPSSWSQLKTQSSKAKAELTVVDVPRNRIDQPSRTASRTIAVAAATLAACLMLIVMNNFSGTNQPEATMPVSAGANGSAAVDDVNTTLQEIEGIDLEQEKTNPDSSVRPSETNKFD